MMVQFNPTSKKIIVFSCLHCRSSFKNTGNYSTSVSLGCVVGAQCNCKAGAGGCCKHIAALVYNI